MSVNNTDKSEWLNSLIPKFVIYVTEGILLTVGNGLIFAAIARQKVLQARKHYIIVGALALVDCFNGITTFLALLRIRLITSGMASILVGRWDCLLTPWNQIYVWTDPLQSVMIKVTAIDRLLAVYKPIKYYTWGTHYVYSMCGGAFGFIGVVVLIGYVTSYPYQYPEQPAVCFTSYSFNTSFYRFHNYCRIIPALASVVLYCLVGWYYHKNVVAPILEAGDTRKEELEVERQLERKVTVTLGISAIFTLVFFIIPMFVEIGNSYIDTSSMSLAGIIPYTFVINNLNPLMNFAIYTLKQKEMKVAVKYLFKCKTITPTMLKNL